MDTDNGFKETEIANEILTLYKQESRTKAKGVAFQAAVETAWEANQSWAQSRWSSLEVFFKEMTLSCQELQQAKLRVRKELFELGGENLEAGKEYHQQYQYA